MPDPRPRPGFTRRLRLPRRTARLRLTVLYGAAFLACGAAVLAFAYLLYGHTTHPAAATEPPKGPAARAELPGSYAEFRVPVAAVQQAGPYDVLKVPMSAIQQAAKNAVAVSPAQQAKSLSVAEVQIHSDEQRLLTACAIALAVIAMVGAAIGWLIAGRVLRPLRTITAAARRISASSLHERLALPGPDDELKELGDTLDGLFTRLEASFDAQRRFAASASHELRTPLTRERTLLQVTLADPAATTGTWQAVSRELLASNAEQGRLIEALLTLASSEAGPGEREPVDLAAVTSEALAAARPGIGGLGLHVHAGIQPAILDGDPLLVQQLAANLIDNAVRHNIPGGDIQVATGTSQAGAVLSVASSGQVIPAAEVARLFQPFQRLGPRPARRDGGHGLGLSIVRAIATAHAATITAQPRPGGGLAIDVTFPPTPSRQQPCQRTAGAARKSLDRARSPEHDQHMEIRIQCLCIDTADPAGIAGFWESALGWRRTWEGEDQVCLEPPEGSQEDGIVPDLVFLKVPEGKTAKNRLHLDLRPTDQLAEVARLEALGARRVSIGQGDVSWVVMADPDGNEFDVLQPLAPAELPPGHDALGRRIAAGAQR